MKKFFFILAAACSACLLYAGAPAKGNSVPATDSRITFIGRTLEENGNVSFDWSGVYAKITFKGSGLAMRASDTKKNFFNVWLDDDMAQPPLRVISTSGTDSLIVLVDKEDLSARYAGNRKALHGAHTVILQKRTEGEQGRTTVRSFQTDGEFLQAPGVSERLIEFVGDSYTCGYGTENSVKTDPFRPETENCNLSYAPIVARFFGADYLLVAHSGMGVARNYNDKFKDCHMPERYLRTFDEDPAVLWKAKAPQPDLTVVYLSANDFSTGRQPALGLFASQYLKLLKAVKANYGEGHPILCVAAPGNPMIPQYVQTAVERSGLENVHYLFLTPMVYGHDSDLGASWHPNYRGQIKKAYAMIPYVSTLLQWEIGEKAVK